MTTAELSQKYATAVFSQAMEKWVSALEAVQSELSAKSSLAETLQDKSRSFSERKKELDKVIPDSADQPIQNFLYTMLKEGDIGLLGQVIDQIERMMRGGPQVEVAQVTTATALSDEDKENFQQKLRQKYGQELEFVFNVDASIVGGVIVQIGDKLIDGSVSTRLESMSNRLGVKI